MVLFVFQIYPVCNFGLGTVRSEREIISFICLFGFSCRQAGSSWISVSFGRLPSQNQLQQLLQCGVYCWTYQLRDKMIAGDLSRDTFQLFVPTSWESSVLLSESKLKLPSCGLMFSSATKGIVWKATTQCFHGVLFVLWYSVVLSF